MPTGSSTPGFPSRCDSTPQIMQALNFSAEGVPVLRTVAALRAVISAISSGACAIMGLAPTARPTLAQSLAETMLLTQWSSGFSRPMAVRREKSSIAEESPY